MRSLPAAAARTSSYRHGLRAGRDPGPGGADGRATNPAPGLCSGLRGTGSRHSYSPRKSMPRRPTTSARSCGGSTKPAWSWSAWRGTCASSATCCWGAYGGRIVNIHPSLLPAFRGAHAIEQALEYGVKVFGVTIHYVDATLDGGKIISQRRSDTTETTSPSWKPGFMRWNIRFI